MMPHGFAMSCGGVCLALGAVWMARVLVVEDDRAISEGLAALLRADGMMP